MRRNRQVSVPNRASYRTNPESKSAAPILFISSNGTASQHTKLLVHSSYTKVLPWAPKAAGKYSKR